jgi:AcrR family transcriptional regulator
VLFHGQTQGPSCYHFNEITFILTKAIRFSSLLTKQVKDLPSSPKKIVTRAKILAATARQLETVGYSALTVKDIVTDACMARGTFYLYFESFSFAAEAVMIAYFKFLAELRPATEARDTFDRILQTNQYYVASYARNASLLACIEPLREDRPAFRKYREQNNHNWCQRVIHDFEERTTESASKAPAEVKALLVWSMSAMVDELLKEIYIRKSPHLRKFSKQPDQVAEIISLMWFRAFYAQDVAPEKLRWVSALASIEPHDPDAW